MSTLDQAAFPMPISGATDAGNYTADGLAGLTKLEKAAITLLAGRFASMTDGRGWTDADITEATTAARALFAELEKGE